MNNLYNYASRTGYVLPQQLHLCWRTILLVFGAIFMLVSPVLAQQPAANIDQIRNGSQASPISPGSWVNGNAGAQNAHYIEGHSIGYRTILTALPANTTVTIVLGYDIKHSDRNAIDYLTHYQRLQPHTFPSHTNPEVIDPTINTPFAGQSATSTTSILAPGTANSPVAGQPATSFNGLPADDKRMSIWGATFVNGISGTPFSYVSQGSLTASNAETQIRVTFRTGSSGGTVVLAWGGHIASQAYWGLDANGVPRSAAGISGSPYHMRLKSWGKNLTGVQDGSLPNLGNQDRSLSADAVIPPPDCTINPGTFNPCPGGTATYSTSTGTGLTFLWTVTPSTVATINGSATGSSITVNHLACGTYTVSLRVTQSDGQFTTCSTTGTIVDNIAPVITLSAGTSGGATALGCNPTAEQITAAFGTATVTDNCASNLIPTVTTAAVVNTGTCTRSQTRTWTATDACGNTSTVTRIVTWTEDAEAPVITATGSEANNADLGCNPTAAAINAALGTATATDNCGVGTPSVVTGDVVVNGCSRSQTRTWNVTDACGNAAVTVSRTITWTEDTEAPEITLSAGPTNGTTALGCNPTAAAINAAFGTGSATDNCGDVTVSHSDGAVTSNGCLRSKTRTFSSTDACGNTSTATRIVTWIEDTTAPVITLTAGENGGTTTLPCNPTAAQINAAFGTGSATDNCGAVTVNTSDGTVVINGSNRSQTRTFTSTDACGNTSTVTRIVTWTICDAPHFFPTGTECADYASGTAPQLAAVCYAYSGNTVTNATPGVYFYWTTFTAPGGNFTLKVTQVVPAGFKKFLVSNDNITAYNSACSVIARGSSDRNGDASITIRGVAAGQVIRLRVMYDVKTIIGSTFTGSVAPDVFYNFKSMIGTTEVADSQGRLKVSGTCGTSTTTTTIASQKAPEVSDLQVADSENELRVNPNPVVDRATVTFTLKKAGDYILELHDVNGRVVKQISKGKAEANKVYSFEIDRSSLSNGIYMTRLSAGKFSKTVRISLIR